MYHYLLVSTMIVFRVFNVEITDNTDKLIGIENMINLLSHTIVIYF